MVTIKQQKYLTALFLFSINTILSSTFLVYPKEWYVYLFLLALASLINAFSCLFIIGNHIFCKINNNINNNNKTEQLIIQNNRISKRNYLYIVPCYNESKEELMGTISSLLLQRKVEGDKRAIMIICDGRGITGEGNEEPTDVILKNILQINNISWEYYLYTTWDKPSNCIIIYKGILMQGLEEVPFILFIKNKNYGKRDSLVLARKCCYQYNLAINGEQQKNVEQDINENIYEKIDETIDYALIEVMIRNFSTAYNNEKIDYIIGIDADTIFDYNCSYELIQGIEAEENVYGCVGFVEVSPEMDMFSFFVLYQYAEYIFAQCLRRYAQSKITKKVNCLSGCVQILRVAEETCGEKILGIFNYLPKEEENIFNHIRSYASEDRNHVCHMLSLYPHIKTTQTVKAIAYTKVPTSIAVFISQRRRWCLGANANDMLLVYLPGINFLERISSFVNVVTFSIAPFVFIATVMFIKTIIEEPTMLMLYLSTIILVPFTHAVIIVPICIKHFSFRETMYYYLSLLCFFLFGSLINLFIYFYSIMCMDVIKWGKTRMVQNNTNSKRLSILVKPDNIAIRCLDLLSEEEKNEKEEEIDDDERFISIKEGNSQKDYYFDDLQSIFV